MNTHARYEELLLLYVAGQLNVAQRAEIQEHLKVCIECQADMHLWTAVSMEIKSTDRLVTAPPALAEQVLERTHKPGALAAAFRHTWGLLLAQTLLVQREIWPASAAVMAMGVVVALTSGHAEIIYFLAPLVAASTLAMLFGPDHDPALELTLSTPTSSWKILLARLSVVSAYNLLLALVATLLLLFFVPPGLLGSLILGWLGPLTFLSALALLLSLWLGTSNAVAIAYALWMLQYAPFKELSQWMASPVWASVQTVYQHFWHSPVLLLLLSCLVIVIAMWSTRRPMFKMSM